MNILDRYLLKKFLSAFIFVVAILVAVICIIDFTEKNEDFIRSNVTWNEILFDHYLNFIPYIANMLSPITAFIAAVFVTAKLASHTEIIAMVSSGINFKRILLPYFIGSSLIALVIFFLINWIIPNANKTRVAFEIAYIKNPFYYNIRNIHIKIAPDTYIYMESYNNTVNVGYQFCMEIIKDNNLYEKLKTNKITWLDNKKAWRLEKYILRTFDGMNETITYGGPVDTIINLKPEEFKSTWKRNETLTLNELNDYIEELKKKGAENIEVYLIEKYERFTYPFAIIILTIIGVIMSAKKASEGVGFRIALGFLVAFVYIIFVVMNRSLAQSGSLHPLLAVWLPNIVFAIVGMVLYKIVPK